MNVGLSLLRRWRHGLAMSLILCGVVLVVAITAHDVWAQSESDEAGAVASAGESFASAFFVSRIVGPDGQKHIDYFGTALLWLLLLLSVASIGLIGMTAMTNQRRSYVPAGVIEKVRRFMTSGQYRQAMELTSVDESFFSKILNAALKEGSHGFNAVIRSLEQASDELATVRFRRVEYLNILAQVSPMIGLFGTVWGMILAFRAIVIAGGNADPVMLAGGIGTALTTTFWGLLIAIPALASYAIIRNRIDELTTDATRIAEELLNELRHKEKADSRKQKAEPTDGPPLPLSR